MSAQPRTYLVVGGGSGGHITPLLAVATALKEKEPECRIFYVGQKKENLSSALECDAIAEAFSVSAGKFRRYHGESFFAHLFDVKTLALNIRDFFRFIYGTWEAWRLLGKQRPDSIFLKGGFVSVPVGIAARLRRIPYITHDSDAIPGLANRITAKHAVYNTTALPDGSYPYDPSKIRTVGIPLRKEFAVVSTREQSDFKKELQFAPEDPVLFCTGGGLGAQKLNEIIVPSVPSLLEEFPKLRVIHITGKKLFEDTKTLYAKHVSEAQQDRIWLIDYYNDLYKLSGAADVIISRGGATNIAEFAVQAKPCVIVPNPVLTGGQQLHNAKVLSDSQAAELVDEGDEQALLRSASLLLGSKEKRQMLSKNINSLAVEGAANSIASILSEIAVSKGGAAQQ